MVSSISYPQMATVGPKPNLRTITVNFTREGEATPVPKSALFLSRQDRLVQAVLRAADGLSVTQSFLASAFDNFWLIIAEDYLGDGTSALTASRALTISQDVTLSLDLNDGTGSGGGEPATLQAIVRVEGVRADRMIVMVEQQSDGAFRLAGYGRAGGQGSADLDLKITPSGEVYAVSLDDWGVAFEANRLVAVGDVIRPLVFTGWLYRISEAGRLPITEPVWWAGTDETDTRPLGTARAYAVRYYQPIGHGPVPVEV